MPQMPPESIAAIAEHVKPKIDKHKCPVCESIDQWVFAESIFELREFAGGNLVIAKGHSVMPIVVVTCHICGYSMFFNAIHVGAVKR